MKSARLLQLGDIHFPEWKNSRIGDIQDSGAPSALVSAVCPNRLQAAVRKVLEVIKSSKVCCLLFCGDLTSRGNLTEYGACVRYLDQVLDIANADRWSADSIHVVPGNHDVNRALCDPDEQDLYSKFDPLVNTWQAIGLDVLAARQTRQTALNPDGQSVSVFSLNSCIGCGERRHLPAGVRQQLSEALNQNAGPPLPEHAYNLIYEQLDTPAFAEDHLDSLVAAIHETPGTSMPVILAHHNTLPQAVPRIEIYTELINSGRFRSRLASCRRPLLYCHGHIHSDPIEQLFDYRYDGCALLLVSAPLLVDGFNLIEISYARNNRPVGCTLTKFRTSALYGSIEQGDVIRIRLVARGRLAQFYDERLLGLFEVCTRDPIRFGNLREMLNQRLGLQMQEATVRDLIEEAEWLSLVDIDNRELEHRHWQIRRVQP
jgi:hypothetical protein